MQHMQTSEYTAAGSMNGCSHDLRPQFTWCRLLQLYAPPVFCNDVLCNAHSSIPCSNDVGEVVGDFEAQLEVIVVALLQPGLIVDLGWQCFEPALHYHVLQEKHLDIC